MGFMPGIDADSPLSGKFRPARLLTGSPLLERAPACSHNPLKTGRKIPRQEKRPFFVRGERCSLTAPLGTGARCTQCRPPADTAMVPCPARLQTAAPPGAVLPTGWQRPEGSPVFDELTDA